MSGARLCRLAAQQHIESAATQAHVAWVKAAWRGHDASSLSDLGMIRLWPKVPGRDEAVLNAGDLDAPRR